MAEPVVIRQFDAEQAHERPAWFRVEGGTLLPEDENYLRIAAEVTKVGAEGARVVCEEVFPDGNKMGVVATGFEAAATFIIDIHQRGEETALEVRPDWAGKPNDPNALVGNFERKPFGRRSQDFVADQQVQNPQELLAGIRGTLAERGFEDQYPDVYYALNRLSARTLGVRNFGELINPREWLLADPSMHATTAGDIKFADNILATLETMRRIDQGLLRDLTCFGNVKQQHIVDRFRRVRGRIDYHRDTLDLTAGFMVAAELVDASHVEWQTQDAKALSALAEKSIDFPYMLLKGELEQITERVTIANFGHLVLSALNEAERELLVPTAG